MRRGSLSGASWWWLAAWAAVAAAFVALSVWTHGTYFLPFDKRASIWVQDLDRFALADGAFRFVNTLGDFEWIAGLLALMFIALVARGEFVAAALVIGGGAMRYVQLGIRATVERPFSWDEVPLPVRAFPNADSYPSGHIFGEVIAYGLLFAFVPLIMPWRPAIWGVRAFCLFVIVVGGPARLYVGAHWLSDVIGAALLALMYVIPAAWLTRTLRTGASAPIAEPQDETVPSAAGVPAD